MSAPSEQTPSLIWGVLSFIPPEDPDEPELDEPSASPFDIEAIDGTNRGNPTAIVETLPSLLLEGALAMVTGYENREIPIRLRISANDGDALSQAEAALFQQCQLDQPPPLQWTSPVGGSATSVYDTVVATLEEDTSDDWDRDEVLYGERYYLLKLICLPFARAVESTVVQALAPPAATPTTVTIDDCTSTAGWTAQGSSLSSGPTVASGAIRATGVVSNGSSYLQLVRAGAVTMGATPYLEVEAYCTSASGVWSGGQMEVVADGVTYTPVAMSTVDGDGYIRFFYDLTGVSFTSLTIGFNFDAGVPPSTYTLSVATVRRVDTLEIAGTTRQQARTATVAGSAPTQGATRLYDATPAPLGKDILVYTSRNTRWQPNLRPWIDADSAAAAVADSDAVSGAINEFVADAVFLIPAALLTAGTYALVARLATLAASTLTWEARMATTGGATNVVGGDIVITGEVNIPNTGGDWQVFDVGAMILPVVEVEGTGYAVQLTLSGGGSANIGIDEGWLFSLDDGVLTWIKDTEDMEWVEIRSPELGASRPSVWGGRNAVGTGGACIDWKCQSFGPHRFDPGAMTVFTVSTTSKVSQCELEYFARYFGNVRGEDAP